MLAPEELSYSSSLESSRRVPENVTIPSSGSHTAAKVNADFGETMLDDWLSSVAAVVSTLLKSSEMDNLLGILLELGLLSMGLLSI